VNSPIALDTDETEALLGTVLHEAHGPDAHLTAWTADARFTPHGRRQVVRYDLEAEVRGVRQHYQWIGKVYERDQDAGRVAAVMRQLAAADGGAREEGWSVPSVLACDTTRGFLLLTYESGESVGDAMAHDAAAVLEGVGGTLAALHARRVALDGATPAAAVLDDLRPRIAELAARFPDTAIGLRRALAQLERDAPALPATPSFLHGDFGPSNLLWRAGRIVVLDFDKCTRGDPALDLGHLLAQLRRMAVRKPEKLRDFNAARMSVLQAYRRRSAADAGLDHRLAWYERAIVLRKAHRLACNTKRHPDAEANPARQAEGRRLLAAAVTP
jgi:aminoglycoside phosphotransferase (APT) family kinase protein